MIDSHTHLDHGPAPEDELVAAAREAGVNRILTIGMDEEGNRSALAAAERFDEVFAAVGRHPNSAEGFDDAAAPSSPSSRRRRCAARSGRPAWTTTATARRARTRSARSSPRSRSPATPASRS